MSRSDMITRALLVLCLLSRLITAQTTSTTQTSLNAYSIVLSGTNAPGSSLSNFGGDIVPTGIEVSYISYNATRTIDGSTTVLATSFAEANGSILVSNSATARTTSTTKVSLLQGSVGASSSIQSAGNRTLNATVSRTSSSIRPTNTQPCNNHPEFCERSYSNITYIAAHNFAFSIPNNAASNQLLPVIDQLNDGIRMLQGQTHWNATTKTISYCHTSCDLLDAGTAESAFTTIASWVRQHPFDVITILLGNSDFVGVGNYSAPLESSGLARYAYVPPMVPMGIHDWPTLSSMILQQKRVVIFMDYNANQTEVPYILDEFSQLWETPFSPQNRSFPCTQQRPPGLTDEQARGRMYMANHNLNTEISLAGISLLVPTTALINETNAANISEGSLALAANNCAGEFKALCLGCRVQTVTDME